MNTPMQCGHAANGRNSIGEPVCVICSPKPESKVVDQAGFDLTGRESRCQCGNTRPSSLDLAFFEFRGPGSPRSITTCKHCKYHKIAHDKERVKCQNFEPHGAFPYDSHYCGCRGFD